jgi:7-cyano-7-deazaguanine synthase in queuosine biosynthesis
MAFVAGAQYGAGTQLHQCINQTKHNDCATCYAEYQEQLLLANKNPCGVCAAANQNTRGFTIAFVSKPNIRERNNSVGEKKKD